MLILPLKPGVSYDLGNALGRWLDNGNDISELIHQPMNPLQFILPKPTYRSIDVRSELLLLQSLRTTITNHILKPNSHKSCLNDNILNDCYEYHAILLEFEKQGFPVIDDNTIPIELTWKGAYITTSKEKHSSLVWERSVIMYNIVSLLTYQINECPITDRQGCKDAIQYCQLGASILALLKELIISQDIITIDLSIGMITFWEKLLIAEAQYNIYRMVSLDNNIDNTKHNLLSSLAQTGYELYNDALQSTKDPRLQSEIHDYIDEYGTYCKTLSMILSIKLEFHSSVVYRLNYQYGNEIARLRECKNKCDSITKFIKTLSKDNVILYEKREMKLIIPMIVDRLNEADSDNLKIYREKIPITLPDIPSKQLAKISSSLPSNMIQTKIPLFEISL